jgi:uncharacterized membrane protein YdcZ (DUF606 family)
VTSAEPPPPPPPPPPGYQNSSGRQYTAAPAPPPRPEIDSSLLRPSKAWYWVAGAIGAISVLGSTVLSWINTFNNFANPGALEVSLISWLLYIGGVGAAAIIGGVTWSRRNDHKRRLQHEEIVRQGPA